MFAPTSMPHMPQQLTSFIGRQHEISEVSRLLNTTRLLTLTGMGGCGKTRLALQVLPKIAQKYSHGDVRFIQLESLTDPSLLPQTLASAIGVREQLGQPLLETVIEQLRASRLLLVLDNCEHLIAACAPLVQGLLCECPNLTVLATSRERLGIASELAWNVPPLSVPDPCAQLSVEALSQSEAVQLFVERARSSRLDFAITPENAQTVAQLCRSLDGIPLAIELAAAKVRVLTVGQIADRLNGRFRLLISGSETSLPRHRTLEALVNWSYELLTDIEQVLLRRLSVFAGGCTLEAAAMCVGEINEYELIETLCQLVDKSLLIMEERAGEAYYRLLETIRVYAMEKLVTSGEQQILRNKHRDWYVLLAERAQTELTGESQELWLNRLEVEHDNLRTALEWSIQGSRGESCIGGTSDGCDSESAEAALRLSSALWRFWYTRGYLTEGREWLARALIVSNDLISPVRARALTAAGNLAFEQGDDEQAIALHTEALGIRRQIGDRKGIAASLANIGVAARSRGDYKWSEQQYKESLQIFEELNQTQNVAGVLQNLGFVAQCQGEYVHAQELYEKALNLLQAMGNGSGVVIALNNLGEVAQWQGDYPHSTVLLNEALTLAQSLDDKLGIAAILTNLGRLASHQNDYTRAIELDRESLRLSHKLGRKEGIARCYEALAQVFVHGQQERATQLFGAAEALRERIGMPLPPNETVSYEHAIHRARAGLSKIAFTEKWNRGRAMTTEDVIKLACSETPLSSRYGSRAKDVNGNGYNNGNGYHSNGDFDTVSADGRAIRDFVENQVLLTTRECEVLQLAAKGLSDVQIATKLCVSPRTVHSHLYSIYNKLQVTSRSAAIHYAVQYDLL